ncbi:hypothetical protein HY029_03980 [Candidatus Gottesmanbacteria bacterium]|nr:hypothetical protein [Candidatus Gottesmanbacteria bacterium]
MGEKKSKINYLILIFIVILVVLQVFIVNKHSTMGDQLTLVNNKIMKIEGENNQISEQIASLSAMTTITEKAKQIGLVSSSQVISLARSLPLAANLKLSL